MSDYEALRAQHGKLVRVTLGEAELVFRPMSIDEAAACARRIDATPDLALTIAHEACLACLLSDVKAFHKATDEYPLAFSPDTGVCERLLELASAEMAASSKAAIRRWRNAGNQLGSVAESLLAFKAYTGGAPDAKALAGALHIAEHIDTMKGLYKLHLSFMRSLSKRRG